MAAATGAPKDIGPAADQVDANREEDATRSGRSKNQARQGRRGRKVAAAIGVPKGATPPRTLEAAGWRSRAGRRRWSERRPERQCRAAVVVPRSSGPARDRAETTPARE
jgi:hypothetical protein